jgi:uncharacterized lipoprotein YmbA
MKHAAWCVFAVAAMLAGCASNPEQSVYIMPASLGVTPPAPVGPGRMDLKLRPVIVPDYLDTTDLVTRIGPSQIEASRTGRWGERLSEGVRSALAADLGHRLRSFVGAEGPTQTASVQIEVTVSAFDVTPATSLLAASWTFIWPGDSHEPVMGNATFTTSVAQPGGDVAVVAAMADTVGELSEAIATMARRELSQ